MPTSETQTPQVIIPAAGFGRRFREEGIPTPKPLIHIAGAPMIAWALDPIPLDWKVTIVCRQEDREWFTPILAEWDRPVTVVALPGPTEGAACTVLTAALCLPPADPAVVLNCDQWFQCDVTAVQAQATREAWGGYILTFPATEDRWSYVRVTADGWVQEVAEKRPISEHATVGLYGFATVADLVEACAWTIAENRRTRGEFYLAPVYHRLLFNGRRIKAIPVEEFHGLGTPEDMGRFITHLVETAP